MHQRARLAGAGSGDDQQRFVAMLDRLSLPVVEVLQQIAGLHSFRHAGSTSVRCVPELANTS